MTPYKRPFACEPILHLVSDDMTGFEIGVFVGDSSEEFLRSARFMYFIDPFSRYEPYPDKGILGEPDKMREAFERRCEAVGHGRYEFINDYSAHCVDRVPKVQFGFLDGNHAFEYVTEDLRNYWPKICPKGFLAGHDYNVSHNDVMIAVNHFAKMINKPVAVFGDCWLIQNI